MLLLLVVLLFKYVYTGISFNSQVPIYITNLNIFMNKIGEVTE